MEEPSFQPIMTLYDAVTDSPVFRSNVYRYDYQLDHLEQWLDSFSRHLKLYTEKLNKFNQETMNLYQNIIPEGIDETLIDPNFTRAIIKGFADTLQTSLSFKSKLLTNLEESLLSPLQQFVKIHLRDFKNFRKQHEKALERYEAQLAKYSALSKTKEPSAIREEAFRLHEARKEYVHLSGQHVIKILNFRSLLEHCLVERFSAATVAHKDLYNDIQVWANLDAALSYWKQWLADDKFTCSYQLHKQQVASKKLEDEFIRLTAPERDIVKYITPPSQEKLQSTLGNSKWGYFFVKVSRHSWARKWFFIHSGYFGCCSVESSGKQRSSITLETKVCIKDCNIQVVSDIDRRFCFEVSQSKQQNSFVLQAETKEIMQDWMRIFTKNKEDESMPSSPISLTKSSTIIRSKSTATTALSSPITTTTTDILHSNTSSSKIKHNDSSSTFSNLSIISNSDDQSKNALNDKPLTLCKNYSKEGVSIVMVSTTPDTEATLSNTSSITPLLVWEAARCSPSTLTTKRLPSVSWGIPWSLVPAMMNQMHEIQPNDVSLNQGTTSPGLPQVIWPAKPVMVDIPKADMNGYTEEMNAQNRELRRLFGGVKPEEVVLDVFVGCLRMKPTAPIQYNAKEPTPSKPSLDSQISEDGGNEAKENEIKPPSKFGFAYTGRGFITQDTFWFYSCVLMSCINSVAIRLKDIDEVKVIRNPSVVQLTKDDALKMKSDMVISISLVSNTRSDIKEPLIIGTLMDNIELIADKIKFAVSNAKADKPMPVRNMYNKMQSISSSLTSYKTVTMGFPLTFNSAISHIKTTAQNNHNHSSTLSPARPHAATVGPEAIVNPSNILKATRQRGESEPVLAPAVVAVVPKPKVKEPAKPDPDMLPSHIICPEKPVECNCDDHLERQDAQIMLPISAKRCYDLLFSNEQTAPPTTGGIWERKTAAIEGHDLSVTKWEMSDGKMQRILKYWMPVSNPIVRMKEAEVVETQILITKEEYISYTVQISTKTAALPYADAFIPSVRYCITWIDKSHCQLTCYLGVRWVKSVLVRSIVTRAALKGMSDSVGIFVSILKEEAENLKDKVDETRRQNDQFNEDLENSGDDNDESIDESVTSMDLVREEEKEGPSELEYPIAQNNDIVQKPASKATSVVEKTAISPSVSSTPSPSKDNDNTLKIPNKRSTVVKKNTEDHAVKPLTSRGLKKGLASESPTSTPPMTSTSFLSKATGFLSISLQPYISLLLLCFALYISIIWFHSGAKVVQDADSFLSMNISQPVPVFITNKSTSRSVYLRDLDEGFLKNTIEPPYARTNSYKAFLKSKKADDSLTADKDAFHHQMDSRQWHSVDHYRLAADLELSRERIAMLRHDMLTIFQVLNRVDSQLIESEFMNWLLDARLKCRHNSILEQDNDSEDMSLCYDVKQQLSKLF